MSALVELCFEEVKEQMMRLDKIVELHENLKAEMMFCTFRTVYIVFAACVCFFRSVLCANVRFIFF